MLAEPKGSTKPTSEPHHCTVFPRIYISLPCHTRFPKMLLKKNLIWHKLMIWNY